MKTLILTHADCDGICAGALALARYPGSRVFFTKPVSLLADLKYNGQQNQEQRFGRIVICDIALTKRDAPAILKELKSRKQKGTELLYFDHHPLPETVNRRQLSFLDVLSRSESACTAEQVYRHFQSELPRECVWLAIYGAIGDYLDNTSFIEQRLLNWDKRTIYFEVSTMVMGIKNDKFGTYDAKRKMAGMLAKGKNPSDIPGLVQAAKEAVNREFRLYKFVKKRAKAMGKVAYLEGIPAFGFRGPSALFAATVRNKPVGLCIYKRQEHLDITIRTRDPNLNLGKLAEQAAEAVGGSGGGLVGAAGARVPKNSLQQFLKKLNNLI